MPSNNAWKLHQQLFQNAQCTKLAPAATIIFLKHILQTAQCTKLAPASRLMATCPPTMHEGFTSNIPQTNISSKLHNARSTASRLMAMHEYPPTMHEGWHNDAWHQHARWTRRRAILNFGIVLNVASALSLAGRSFSIFTHVSVRLIGANYWGQLGLSESIQVWKHTYKF